MSYDIKQEALKLAIQLAGVREADELIYAAKEIETYLISGLRPQTTVESYYNRNVKGINRYSYQLDAIKATVDHKGETFILTGRQVGGTTMGLITAAYLADQGHDVYFISRKQDAAKEAGNILLERTQPYKQGEARGEYHYQKGYVRIVSMSETLHVPSGTVVIVDQPSFFNFNTYGKLDNIKKSASKFIAIGGYGTDNRAYMNVKTACDSSDTLHISIPSTAKMVDLEHIRENMDQAAFNREYLLII